MRRGALSLVTVVAACHMGEIDANLGAADAPVEPIASDAPIPVADAPPRAPDARIVADARPHADAPAVIPLPDAGPALGCLPGMVRIGDYCIDGYEAYVVELVDTADGVVEMPHSPYYVVDGLTIRAKVAARRRAAGLHLAGAGGAACANAGKRLCSADEFPLACRGPDADRTTTPTAARRTSPATATRARAARCARFFGNDPPSGPTPTSTIRASTSGTAASRRTGALSAVRLTVRRLRLRRQPARVGLAIRPTRRATAASAAASTATPRSTATAASTSPRAHELTYHDYSTGFRCCMDAGP